MTHPGLPPKTGAGTGGPTPKAPRAGPSHADRAARRRPIRSASILIPTFQGAEFLERLLSSLAEQRFDRPFDVLAIDSGSVDGTLEILARFGEDFPVPLRVESIHGVEFDHGDTRNLLGARSTGDLLVFLTQDAIPVGSDWLARLAANFEDPEVGAVTCRNVPRPDARPATKILSAGDPGYGEERRVTRLPDNYADLGPEERRALYNFNDVASAFPRELWERHPFPRTWFGEDILQARAFLEAGYAVVYDNEASVEHSHDYTPEETYQRAKIDGRFGAEWLDRIAIRERKDVATLCKRLAPGDRKAARAVASSDADAAAIEAEIAANRHAAFRGLQEGGKTDLRRPGTTMLERIHLHVLFVVHGFPPETWAGTEIYTLELAKALVERGHRCTVLARSPGPAPGETDEGPEFRVWRETFQGLEVVRYVHRLQHVNLRESYSKAGPERVFREALAELAPDVVHFQHLIHSSAGLVEIAKRAGIATVVHCHDYWAICPRVQMIRPDGKRCAENQGAGCLLCVKGVQLEHVGRVRLVGQLAGPTFGRQVAKKLRDAPAGSGFRRRFEGLSDLLDRGPEVLSAYGAADLRISPSRFLRDKLLETGAFDPHSFLYSDNGLRTDHVQALEKRADPAGRMRFGFVGSLVWYKGGEVMLKAMARLRERAPAGGRGAMLHVYGGFEPESDPHHAELAKLAGPDVVFHGRFDNQRLSEVYADLDVLIVPSIWWENSPITIHEAFLTQTPVVASDIGGMAEYVRDGVDGLHFRAGDPDDLARVLARFLDEPDLLNQLSADWMRIKSSAENAAEVEFRYRALVARNRERAIQCLLEGAADLDYQAEGTVERQGQNLLLLRPDSSVRFTFRRLGSAQAPAGELYPIEVRLRLFSLAGEHGVRLGGRVGLMGGQAVPIETVEPTETDTVTEQVFSFELSEPTCELELRTTDLFLRIESLVVNGVESACEDTP